MEVSEVSECVCDIVAARERDIPILQIWTVLPLLLAVRGLVDEVPEMDEEVDVLLGDVMKCAVVPVLVILAGDEREVESLGTRVWIGKRPTAANPASGSVVGEPVVVFTVRIEWPVEIDFNGVIVLGSDRIRSDGSAIDDIIAGEAVRGRDFDAQWLSTGVRVGRDPRPENDPLGRRAAAGDRLGEHGIGHSRGFVAAGPVTAYRCLDRHRERSPTEDGRQARRGPPSAEELPAALIGGVRVYVGRIGHTSTSERTDLRVLPIQSGRLSLAPAKTPDRDWTWQSITPMGTFIGKEQLRYLLVGQIPGSSFSEGLSPELGESLIQELSS